MTQAQKVPVKENNMNVYKVDYPQFSIWETNIPEAKRLKIINPSDFPRQTMLRNLGLEKSPLASSFGITDLDEIIERQNVLRFLLDHPHFVKTFGANEMTPYVPEDGQDYIKFNETDNEHAHNPYWEKVLSIADTFAALQDSLPARLVKLQDFLTASQGLERTEMELATTLRYKILNMINIEGMMRFEITQEGSYPYHLKGLKLKKSSAIGHKEYADLNKVKVIGCPEWVESRRNPLNWIGIGKIVRSYIGFKNSRNLSKARKAVLTEAPEELIRDVRDGVWEMIGKVDLSEKEARLLAGAEIEVAFRYDRDGLQIQIFDMDLYASVKFEKLESTILDTCDAFTGREKRRLCRLRSTILNRRNNALSAIAANEMIHRCNGIDGFFGGIREIDAYYTDRKYRTCDVSELASRMGLADAYEAICRHREYLYGHLCNLSKVIDIARAMRKASEETGKPLTFPEFTDENVVSFDSVFPVQLMSRLDMGDIISIENLCGLNGQTCITGNHAGGKSITLTEIPILIYRAQSGLPILGSGVKLNVKQVIGLLAIERGEGSTVEIIAQKLTAIFQSMESVSGERVILFLDEVGSATQEQNGIKLGKKLLQRLGKDKNVSVVFSTQILDLAKYAEKKFGAQCFKLDSDHSITKGIGDGDMSGLLKRTGLDEYLSFEKE